MTTVLISGAIANKPYNSGATWTRLSYILGLRKLGFVVFFVEQIQPETCVDKSGLPVPFEASANINYFRAVTEQFGLVDCSALICGGGEQTYGLTYTELLARADSAALLVNISGHLGLETIKRMIPVKAYIDLDPAFTQLWQAAGASPRLGGHDYYFTVGENIGTASCSVPIGNIPWRPTRQPVVKKYWPVSREGAATRFTSIASWRGPFGPVQHEGKTLGSKVRQFRKYATIPTQFDNTFELALDIHPGDYRDRELLLRNSWKLVDPRTAVPDPCAFQRYVRASGAEFSVAQEIYVETNSGWFSDRTTRYLASGKPVLVEDTGFSRSLPVGDGLLAFNTPERAADGVRRITRDYAAHATAARQIAEEYFDSDRVLADLVSQMGVCP